MLLAALVETADSVGAIRSRTAKVERLRDGLIALAPDERAIGVEWLSGSMPEGPLGLGPAIVHAMRHVPSAAAATLSVAQAHSRLEALRAIGGKGSAARRKAALAELFSRATPAEQSFLARLLVGELRQGALEGVMADAIAAAAGAAPAAVRRAIMLAGAIGPVAAAALEAGAEGVARFRLTLYKPVSPMLASPTQDVASALTALTQAIFEFKLDGARVQIHKGARGVRIYSRTGNDVTASLPEIVATIESLGAEQLILDGEVIALEPSGRPRPFQQTMRRFGRKLGVAETQTELPLSLFCFDCLQAGGIDVLDRPTAARAAALASIVPASLTVPRLVTSSRDAAEAFLREALAAGHEGLVAKSPSAPYEAGNRGSSWLKIKVAHTLDLVVLAAEWGNGRRQGWLSNLHLGARSAAGGFVMLGKTFKGLTDELLEWQTQKLRSLAISRTDGYVVHVKPELVVEIAFNELQKSSRYPGGLALRFARVVRYRPDKTAADADTIETVRRIAGVSSES